MAVWTTMENYLDVDKLLEDPRRRANGSTSVSFHIKQESIRMHNSVEK
jgi:hypothetical protein